VEWRFECSHATRSRRVAVPNPRRNFNLYIATAVDAFSRSWCRLNKKYRNGLEGKKLNIKKKDLSWLKFIGIDKIVSWDHDFDLWQNYWCERRIPIRYIYYILATIYTSIYNYTERQTASSKTLARTRSKIEKKKCSRQTSFWQNRIFLFIVTWT
jgi:hypothetical protein